MKDKAEKVLKETEKYYRTLLDNIPVGIFRTTSDGKFVSVNSSLIKLLGYQTKEEVLKIPTLEMWADINHRKELIEILQKQGSVNDFQLQIRQRNGNKRWVSLNVKRVPCKGEEGFYMDGIVEDITDRKQVLEELSKSEKSLRLIYETTGDVLFQLQVDPDDLFRFLSVNKAFLTTTGLTVEQIVGKTTAEVIPEPSHSVVLRKYNEAIREKRMVTWEETTEYPSGKKVGYVAVTPAFDPDGNCTHLIGSVCDITERKKMEKELQKSKDELEKRVKDRTVELESMVEILNRKITEHKHMEEALRNEKKFTETALNTQQDTFFLFESATGRAIRWNRVFNDITGYTDEEISRLPAPDAYYCLEDLKRAAIFIEKVLETGIGKIELELICKDGRKVLTEYNVAVIKDEAGSPKYIISIGRDITERKQAEEALEKAHGALEIRVKERTVELESTVKLLQEEITERKKIENELQETEKRLLAQTTELTESNAALKALLRQREEDREEIENNILSNVKHLVQPYIEKLKRNKPVSDDLTNLKILESNLEEIVSPFASKLSSKYLGFSPRELQVAALIKDGKQDKDIIEILNISPDTIKVHRKNIRKKLGIHREKINLKTKLLSFDK
jgi:PAS domain S-box-containing protein